MHFLSSCDSEDDISSIFVGKTWYITGGTINGTNISGDELKSIYAVPSSYFLYFSSDNTFNGVLNPGSSISGTWTADGKKNLLSLSFSNVDNIDGSVLSHNIYNILKSSTSYSGDEHNIKIKEDSNNYIRFTNNRTPSY